MQLKEHHINTIKKIIEDKVNGIYGIPEYEYSDKVATLTVRYKIDWKGIEPLISTDIVLNLLKKGFWVVWAGMHNQDTFEVAISTTDEWMEYD